MTGNSVTERVVTKSSVTGNYHGGRTDMKYTAAHIAVLAVGIAYLMLGAFSSALWFDEEYTVGLVRHGMAEMIDISIYDVHPPLYYILLKLYTYIAGNSVVALRIFSVLCTGLLSLLGFTHIRKDFGRKCGLLFSVLVFIMPCSYAYSLQIRMYSITPLFVTLAAIYGYRIIKERRMRPLNGTCFVISSLGAAYCHWYGLVAVGLMNLFMLAEIIGIEKNTKTHALLKNWMITAVCQLVLYIPGFFIFAKQAGGVKSFWISVKFPDIVLDILGFNLSGEPGDLSPVYVLAGLMLFAAVFIMLVRLYRRDKAKAKVALYALGVYFGVIALFLLASVIAPIFYVRYSIISYGLLLFVISYLFAESKKGGAAKGKQTGRVPENIWNIVCAVLLCVLLLFSAFAASKVLKDSYDDSNVTWKTQMAEQMQENDIIAYTGINPVIFTLEFTQYSSYFYNNENWDIYQAYRAFGDNFHIIDDLSVFENYSGRIWMIESPVLYEELCEMGSVKILTEFDVHMAYHNGNYAIKLVEVDFTK